MTNSGCNGTQMMLWNVSIKLVEAIVGATLPKLQDEHLKEIGIKPSEIKQVRKFIEDVTKDTSHHKIVNDPIHGHIKLHPLCVKIIDTPEFQRLRFIKQLGNGYFVYPGASHNRFEHSHGPFSHLFDGMFIPAVKMDTDPKWTLEKEFEKYGLTEQDRVFIKEQIDRPNELDQKNWTLNGRPKEKSFLYEEVGNLYEMFHTRRTLHSKAYQHKTTKIIETMVTEALVEANGFIEFTGKDKKKFKMSESIHDMKAFSQMTDDVFNRILNSTNDGLKESREILEKEDTEKMIREAIEKMDKDKPKTDDKIISINVRYFIILNVQYFVT
ncbi:SAMH1-like protein [Mya arenaria]|uniref:SAMH1-like protein n=1 Tax=Mya arenaria TaxID=6604 RepID=A0ABY7ET06_MYAAR|nr:SAMH1-like protein [Mya arenaria]